MIENQTYNGGKYMNSIKTCSFFGHSQIEITEELKILLKELLEDLIVNKNYQIFYFGGMSEFDFLCYDIITELKTKYNFIKRVFCLKDPRHTNPLKRPSWINYNNYEAIEYLTLSFEGWEKRIYFRNIEMINQSDYVLFYVKNFENSGAYKAMKHAIKTKKNFINIVEKLITSNN